MLYQASNETSEADSLTYNDESN